MALSCRPWDTKEVSFWALSFRGQSMENPTSFSFSELSPGPIGAGARVSEVKLPGGLLARAALFSAHLYEAPERMERAVQQQRGPATATAQYQVPEEHLGPRRPLMGRTAKGTRLKSAGHTRAPSPPHTSTPTSPAQEGTPRTPGDFCNPSLQLHSSLHTH